MAKALLAPPKTSSTVKVFTGGKLAAYFFNSSASRGLGDVLITFESEAEMIAKEFGKGNFEVIHPSLTMQTEFPVAIIDKVVDKKGTRKQATAYLNFLYSPEGQEIIARHYFRPRDPAVAKKYAARFPAIRTFTVEEKFGSWDAVQKTHFADGGVYDQITVKR